MAKIYNWGILGPGKIAHKFAESLSCIENACLYGVASRSEERAKEFADTFAITKVYNSYEALVADPNIDIIYIATTNNLHFEHTMLAMKHGKAVLCEKPSTLSTAELQTIIEYSKKHAIFYMEALWTRFLPTITTIDSLISKNTIGEIKHISADFGFKAEYSENNRLFNSELGGGSLWDIGLYTVFLALHILGKPDIILSHQLKTPTGVDMSTNCIFHYNNGASAQLYSTFAAPTRTEAKIVGTNGVIKLHQSFHIPTKVSVHIDSNEEFLPLMFESNGYSYEAREVMQCLDNGLNESPLLPHDFSLLLMQTLEKIIYNATKNE